MSAAGLAVTRSTPATPGRSDAGLDRGAGEGGTQVGAERGELGSAGVEVGGDADQGRAEGVDGGADRAGGGHAGPQDDGLGGGLGQAGGDGGEHPAGGLGGDRGVDEVDALVGDRRVGVVEGGGQAVAGTPRPAHWRATPATVAAYWVSTVTASPTSGACCSSATAAIAWCRVGARSCSVPAAACQASAAVCNRS